MNSRDAARGPLISDCAKDSVASGSCIRAGGPPPFISDGERVSSVDADPRNAPSNACGGRSDSVWRWIQYQVSINRTLVVQSGNSYGHASGIVLLRNASHTPTAQCPSRMHAVLHSRCSIVWSTISRNLA